MNTKLQAVANVSRRPIGLFMAADQVSDYTAAALLDSLPRAQWLLGDKRYDADWTEPIRYDKRRYKRRNRIDPKVGAAR